MLPKQGKLMKVLGRKARGNVKMENPSIIIDRLSHVPSLLLGDSIDGRRNAFGA
jgi:hypothetical protein